MVITKLKREKLLLAKNDVGNFSMSCIYTVRRKIFTVVSLKTIKCVVERR